MNNLEIVCKRQVTYNFHKSRMSLVTCVHSFLELSPVLLDPHDSDVLSHCFLFSEANPI